VTIQIEGDRALEPDGIDRLGFRPMAERLAEALSRGTATDGIVIGVVGRWGSGKTSLLNLTRGAIADRPETDRPYIIEFKPWLVGDRDSLLQSLFAELAAGLDQVEYRAGDSTNLTISQVKSAGTSLRDFAASLGGVGSAAKAVGIVIPWVGTVGAFVSGAARVAGGKKSPSLAGLKRKVSKRLSQLPRPLIVVIDDLDRLEPKETVEVLRLVRSVADFPNVIYVLGYDPDIVAHAVQSAALVSDGDAYMEKIVQITVPVPVPEAFELRRWFTTELQRLALTNTPEEQNRIAEIIDYEGGRYLDTPRSVIRTLDSIRFTQAAVRETVDLTDLVWLQLVKVGNTPLYAWIENYITEISARSVGRVSITPEAITRSREQLNRALQRENQTFAEVCGRLAQYLPGVVSWQGDDSDQPGIFQNISNPDIDRAVRARRLASPDHYRRFFTFSAPTNAPVVSDYESLRAATEESAAATSHLLTTWQASLLTSGVSKTEVMLDRLATDADSHLTSGRAQHLLTAFSDVLDDLGRDHVNDMGGPEVWRRAQRLLPRLLELVGEQRAEILRNMFREGRALSWLTSVLRRETFAHGRAGDRPTSDHLLTEGDLDLVSAIMVERYREMSFEEIAQLPQPLSALFAWQQAGDPDGPSSFLANHAQTDEGLMEVLETLSGVVRASSRDGVGEFVTLSRSNLNGLLDYDQARERTETLASPSGTNEALRARAEAVLGSFQLGDRFNI
jgi:predicted KAP-like P-loop ATPase